MCAICDGIKTYTEKELKYAHWTALYIGKNGDDTCYIYAQGDAITEYYYPKFCPECGRRVNVDRYGDGDD
jgi:hypothetical protein